jgi:hypothetical protein
MINTHQRYHPKVGVPKCMYNFSLELEQEIKKKL